MNDITLTRTGFTVTHQAAAGLLTITTGRHTMQLAVQGAVNRPGTLDTGTRWERIGRSPIAGGERLVFRAERSIWDSKSLIVDVLDDALLVSLEVGGAGDVERVVFGAGFPTALAYDPRATMTRLPWAQRGWSRAWLGSPLSHRRVLNPQPNAYDEQECDAVLAQRVTCATTFGAERFNTFFAPPLYAYVFDDAWCLGIVAPPGHNRYHHCDYTVGSGWGIELHFDGRTAVAGTWRSPALRIAPCASADDGLVALVAHLGASGCAPRQGNRTPDWARKPMLCGWGQQSAWAQQHQAGASLPVGSPITGGAGGYASEVGYAEMVATAERHGLPFGVLTIDMGWSPVLTIPAADPRLWTDLKGFIAAQHAKGRKVLLWLATWNAGGLDPALRMPHDDGLNDVCDPTNPEFRRQLVQAITHCIAPDGLDADGFKLDFTGDIPRGAGYRPAAGGPTAPWGMELLRDYVGLIHGAMRAAKADSVLETHCANPYFADVTDYLRLNDIFAPAIDVRPMMDFRARMARIANPAWALDTDNDPFISREGWLDYMRHQPRIGVPSLYALTHLSSPAAGGADLEAIHDADLAEVAAIWRRYLAQPPAG